MYEVDQHRPQLEEEGTPTRQVTEHHRVAVPQEVASRTYVQEHSTSLSQSTLDLDDLRLLIRKKLEIKGVAIVSHNGLSARRSAGGFWNVYIMRRLTEKPSIILDPVT